MKKGYRGLVVLVIVLGILSLLRDGFIGPIALATGLPDEMVWQGVTELFLLALTFLVAKIFNEEFIHGYIERSWSVKVPNLIGDIASGIVIFIGVCLILSLVFHQNISALIVTGAGSAAILGFALKDFAVALATGIMLNFEDTFKVGDKVVIDGNVGVVHKITWRNTVLLTDTLEAVFIPNVKIADAVVTNYSLPNPNRKQMISVTIDYGVSVESVERILYAATLGASGVKLAAPPIVSAMEMTDTGVRYEVRFILQDYRDLVLSQHAIIKSILECMRVANITVAGGITDTDGEITLNSNTIANRSKDLFYLVQQVKVFHHFSKEAWQTLSDLLIPKRFSSGQVIVEAGSRKHMMFIVAEGIASRMRVDQNDQLIKQRFIATEFFGRNALFAFMPYLATVTAETDVLLYELNESGLKALLVKHPELTRLLADTLASLDWIESNQSYLNEPMHPQDVIHFVRIHEGHLAANYGKNQPLQ